jgi:hypothetical protein
MDAAVDDPLTRWYKCGPHRAGLKRPYVFYMHIGNQP